jgi:hypothetical protein
VSDGTTVLIDALRRRGGKVREVRPGHWTAQCPAHDDKNPSLSIDRSADGKPLIHCFAECRTESVLAALGLTWSDVLGDHRGGDVGALPVRQARGGLTLHFADLDAAARAILAQLPGAAPAGQWLYQAADGTPVLAQLRFDLPEHDPITGKAKKTFRILRKTAKGIVARYASIAPPPPYACP